MRWDQAYAMGYEQAPLSYLYEFIVFFVWSILMIYLIFDLKYKQRAIGAFVVPFAFGGMIWANGAWTPPFSRWFRRCRATG